MDIQLNFINSSNDHNDSDIVVFQKNVASGYSELAVAWLVIQRCGIGDNHPFIYPTLMQVSASDSYGNYTPRLDAYPGQAFAVSYTDSGDQLAANGNATYPTEVQLQNNLQQGAINASIYRDGRTLAQKTSIAPAQMAAFQFNPTIWIGAVSQVNQGQVMNSAIVEQVNTELSLLGIVSADIVMTGGGPGANSMPFNFTLQNIVRA
jgi:surface antigen